MDEGLGFEPFVRFLVAKAYDRFGNEIKEPVCEKCGVEKLRVQGKNCFCYIKNCKCKV